MEGGAGTAGGGFGSGGVGSAREERVSKDAAERMRVEFSTAASSLARLYKMSSEARVSGSRSAYRDVVEWVRLDADSVAWTGGVLLRHRPRAEASDALRGRTSEVYMSCTACALASVRAVPFALLSEACVMTDGCTLAAVLHRRHCRCCLHLSTSY